MGRVLLDEYGGKMLKLIETAESRADLKRRLKRFKGIGDTGARIFMRELPEKVTA